MNIVELYETYEMFRVSTKDGERESSRRNKCGKLEGKGYKSHL